MSTTDFLDLVQRLGNVSFFKHMPVSALKDIISAGQLLRIPTNSIIFREGEPASGMYVLLSGQVHLSKIGLQGGEYIVYIVKPVIMFNEVTVIDNQPNPVTAVANLDCITWKITYESYQILMRRHPEMGLGLLKILAKRNRILLNRYEDLKNRSVLARTAKLLLALSQGGLSPINRYEHSNQKIAAMAGTVPEAVSRSIKNLKDKGVIECTRAQITVLHPDALSESALIDKGVFEYSSTP